MPSDEQSNAQDLGGAASLESRLAEVEAALARERVAAGEERAAREAALRQIASLKRELGRGSNEKAARREVMRLERELNKVYGSRTWRAGRVVWSIGTAPRRVVTAINRRRQQTTHVPALTPPVVSKPAAPHSIDYTLIEDTTMRRRYQDALDRDTFSDPGSPKNVAMTVYTDDLDAGRGDVYVAVGLGRYLERLGYEVIYLPQESWYDLPEGTAVYVAMLDWVQITRIPSSVCRVAWIRNRTDEWMKMPWLPMYDLVLCSSTATEAAVRRVYPGPTSFLPLAVDAELFRMTGRTEDRAGVVTTQNNWGTERAAHRLLAERNREFPLGLYGQDRLIAEELSDHVRGPVPFFSLPSLYSQAAVVVDDLLVPNAAYGNTNSRPFEALACGAVVLTDQATGLDDLGLSAIPVYRNAIDLFDLIDVGLGSGDLQSLAKKLRATVLENHTFRVRAQEFDVQLERIRTGSVSGERSSSMVLGFFPDYRNNPYQEMLWSQLRSEGAIPVGMGADFDTEALLRASVDAKAFHLNWTAPILGPAANEADRLSRYRRFLGALDAIADADIPIVWTLHNVLPHECADPAMEQSLRQEIADRVDAIHVMCERSINETAGRYALPPSKIRVIPHPSYLDVYPNLVDQETARYELGLLPHEMVYLFVGQIRHYKGVDLLLDAFERVNRHRPQTRLVLAGEPGRFPGRPEIEQRAQAHPAVLASLKSIADDDLQLYLNAADVVVLPYRSMLNSGSMMLAYSFARPVIVAELGCVADGFDSTAGIAFSWEAGESALYDALRDGERLRDDGYRRAAHRVAERFHYLDVSVRFRDLITEAMRQRGTTTR